MRRLRIDAILQNVFPVLAVGIFVALLVSKLQLSVVRYFDADEFAYLHWAHNVFSGSMPYRDFLFYVPPGFLYVLVPLFMLFGGTEALISGRVLAWLVFVGLCLLLGALHLSYRDEKWSWPRVTTFVFPGIVLAFLPMPSDKFLEIRPDNLAVLLALAGLWFQVKLLRSAGLHRSYALGAGVLYGWSLMILPKTLPQVALAYLVMAAWWLWADEETKKARWQVLLSLLYGLCIPIGIFFVWIMVVAGDTATIKTVLYSLTKLPFEVSRIGELFGMQPDLFFYPNTVYYGAPGWSHGLIINHIVWFIGLMTGVLRMVTVFIPAGRKGVWVELLVSGTFFFYIATFMYGYPLRHAQYLIPIAVFVAHYAADAVLTAGMMIPKRMRTWAAAACLTILFLGGLGTFVSVNNPKLMLTNKEDLALLTLVLSEIPADSYVFDLVGATIYFRDPYYVSAVPFGQWKPYLSRPLPSLQEALEQTGTGYVYQGKLGRVTTLDNADRAYIQAKFRTSPVFGSGMLVK